MTKKDRVVVIVILKPKFFLVCLCATLISCQRELPAVIESGPLSVGFQAGHSQVEITRTTVAEDALSTVWEEGDKLALWAVDAHGSMVLEAQPFRAYSVSSSFSFFTSTLSSAMPEGRYSYFASYPVPDRVVNGKAQYTIPMRQDGMCGNGAELLFSNVAEAGAMKAIDWKEGYDHSDFRLDMSPLVHRLRFYMTSVDGLEGEEIEELEVSFPRSVAGKVQVDLAAAQSSAGNRTDATASFVGTGEKIITVFPNTSVPVSTLEDRHYINVSIAPTTFTSGESMDVTIHTQSKIAFVTIPLKSRTFAAGHSTPVRLIPTTIKECPRLFFSLASNPIGEDIQSITLKAPLGCNWGATGTNVFTFAPDELIKVGDSFYAEFYDFAQFEAFEGKDIQITYESDHVTINQTVHIGNISGKISEKISLNVPWLLNENFDDVPSFSSNDEYATSKAGSYSSYPFLNGWAGARVGAEAGKCIRVACRRETSARYDARVDSAPLNAVFKKPTNLQVEFDYGANNQFGGIPIITDGNVGQNCYIGYITTTQNYKSGDKTGTYEYNFYIKEYSGSYDNTPNSDIFILHDIPSSNVLRISWRTMVESQAGTTNTTAWLYIDNVKVKISQ